MSQCTPPPLSEMEKSEAILTIHRTGNLSRCSQLIRGLILKICFKKHCMQGTVCLQKWSGYINNPSLKASRNGNWENSPVLLLWTRVSSLVRELRSHQPLCCMVQKRRNLDAVYISLCNVYVAIEYSACQALMCKLKSSQQPSEKGVIPILQMRTLRPREAK